MLLCLCVFFQYSLCNEPLIELSNPGASGSVFYLTKDDEFIIKTVMHKEAEFLQKLLPGYYMVSKDIVCVLLRFSVTVDVKMMFLALMDIRTTLVFCQSPVKQLSLQFSCIGRKHCLFVVLCLYTYFSDQVIYHLLA